MFKSYSTAFFLAFLGLWSTAGSGSPQATSMCILSGLLVMPLGHAPNCSVQQCSYSSRPAYGSLGPLQSDATKVLACSLAAACCVVMSLCGLSFSTVTKAFRTSATVFSLARPCHGYLSSSEAWHTWAGPKEGLLRLMDGGRR